MVPYKWQHYQCHNMNQPQQHQVCRLGQLETVPQALAASKASGTLSMARATVSGHGAEAGELEASMPEGTFKGPVVFGASHSQAQQFAGTLLGRKARACLAGVGGEGNRSRTSMLANVLLTKWNEMNRK